ncbi:hypothetical protein B9Z19DRAFT_1052015 [Tuber borchii]|uniref:DUF6536 domain-containing protein n=1 Tax=Tuber borchii TaxID=42251 RepID=A0A2T6ZM12_TUBBO|nr:hypothetical protein B9Z19DRAFT_1052015 [Tuber borchii]
MDIGVPSVRNLFRIKAERRLLWIAIGITSIPLHLLYNSAVYTSLAANDFFLTRVTSDHFDLGGYLNATEVFHSYRWTSRNATTGKEYGDIGYQTDSHDTQQFTSMLEGHNASTPSYQDLTPSRCANLYNRDFVSNRRNLFLITNYTSNSRFNNTLLSLQIVQGNESLPTSWMYPDSLFESGRCDGGMITSMVAKGHPWLVTLSTGEEVEVSGCKSEITDEKCKVQFSLGIMIAVICCNLVKACAMIITVVRSREPTLVTLGDAIDSFLRIPDPTTRGICFADRRFIDREWRRGWRTGPRQWKQMGVQRWWTSVSKTRWITCNFFFAIAIIATAVLLKFRLYNDGLNLKTDIRSMWSRGFGKVNSVSLLKTIHFRNIPESVLLANLPQTILSFLFLTYNSLFTCMLAGHEWSLLGHNHCTLRVTSPRPGQRSTYWLQVPYTYAIPLMTLSGLLHWLTSQSIFLARVEVSDQFGWEISSTINTVGYSCIAIIFVLTLCILALLAAGGMGFNSFSAEITTVGCCSAAISAACHSRGADAEGIVGKKVRWGDVGYGPNQGVKHLTFRVRRMWGSQYLGRYILGRGEGRNDL